MRMLIIFAVLFSFIKISGQNMVEPVTVPYVDLNKYTGVWYEYSKIPNSFQKNCISNTTATYSVNQDGSIKVLNKCKEEDGSFDEANGKARIVDKKTNSKLQVSFVSIFGWNLFWGDYWIIGLDENYKWAVIGHPKRKYGWILSRTPSLDNETLNKINDILKKQGYNPNDFVKSKQG